MKLENQQIIFSPTDLANHLSCNYITLLNKKVLAGELKKPKMENRVLDLLRERGLQFEASFLEKQIQAGLHVVQIDSKDPLAEEKTIDAMRAGVDVIFQARLVESGQWAGWSDFVLKVPGNSLLGNWQYEVLDTKLSNETRAGAILQISLYSEKIGAIQGVMPENMHIEKPDGRSTYRVADYISYFRLAKKRLMEAIQQEKLTGYPDAVPHCDICNWFLVCNKQRRQDDHLSFVAGMGRSQIKEFASQEISTLKELANTPLPLTFKPNRGDIQTFQKLREQARLQLEERESENPSFELLPNVEGKGFHLLPEPSDHDIYLDLEGDPMVEPDGREYLFGWIYQNEYVAVWSEETDSERSAYERFMDFAFQVKQEHPDMHIYHYAAYEVTALKRLMGKYASKAEELDYFLRSGSFIDLYAVVKQSLLASVEKYSIKNLEKFYGLEREMDLRELGKIKSEYDFLLESNQLESVDPMMREAIQLYNYDDCNSTVQLHKWLENLRSTQIQAGYDIPRPELAEGEASTQLTAHQELIKPIFEALTADLPPDNRNDEQQAKFILAHMLDWYKREEKIKWWEFFELRASTEEELFEHRKSIAYVQYLNKREPINRSFLDFYTFPKQEADFKVGGSVFGGEEGYNLGTIHTISHHEQTIVIKKANKNLDIHPDAFISREDIPNKDKIESIIALGAYVAEHGLNAEGGDFQIARKLLQKQIQVADVNFLNMNENFIEKSFERAMGLNNGILAIQGPPGTGKSYTCSHMVLKLIAEGKKIGISAMSHAVIENLLQKIQDEADLAGIPIKMIQKVPADFSGESDWMTLKKDEEIFKELGDTNVLAGTVFMWSKPIYDQTVDYLIIDEAGQLSLIDTLAVSKAGKNLILLGDPQQLQQPIQGTHPDGTEVSALEHLLDGEKTIEADKGIFLEKTWRMNPKICAFVSEMFYENKLKPVAGLENQTIKSDGYYQGSGLRYHQVQHEGNVNSSVEEIEEIKKIVADLCKKGSMYVNKDGVEKQITQEDIKIISPYNAQVQALKAAFPGIEIGTVDKFQGQEAPVVIYSVATSTPEDAPRGMEFLYSPNRFNVAVSRAKALFILVANKKIFEPECKSPIQIKLANPFCRYLEMAEKV